MALPSDEQNADSRLQVRFYKRPVHQEQESMDAGRPIYKEFDFVHICVAGDTLTEIDTFALNNHKQPKLTRESMKLTLLKKNLPKKTQKLLK